MQIKLLRFTFLFITVFYMTSCSAQVKSKALKTTIDNLISETVDTIGVTRLQQLQDTLDVNLLDAREKSEYQVSHMKGARHVGYENFDPSVVSGLDKNAPIVIYCSIGYRSEKIGEKLDSMGFTKVYNLYGGIFEWVNQGGEVVEGSSTPTQKIHGYDKWWSRFLQRGEVVLD